MKESKVVDAIIEEDKPFFFPRLVAYIIDTVIVFALMLGLAIILPANENHQKYMDEYETIQAQLIDGKMNKNEFTNRYKDVVYDLDYTNTLVSLSQIVLFILYFIVFQYYNKGQTIGKKIMGIKVVSTKGKDITIDQIAIHSLIANSIIINLLLVASVLFIGREYYYYASLGLQLINYFVIIVALLMIIFRKDGKGIHDVLANTKVVSIK